MCSNCRKIGTRAIKVNGKVHEVKVFETAYMANMSPTAQRSFHQFNGSPRDVEDALLLIEQGPKRLPTPRKGKPARQGGFGVAGHRSFKR